MDRSYLEYLFLDTFSTTEFRKPKSLYYIFIGKRTISVMLQSLRHQISGYFGLFPKLKWENLERILGELCQEDLLTFSEEGGLLTEKGAKQCADYFQKHLRIEAPQQICYVRIIPEFKKRSLFLVQVVSEMSYQNKEYFPLLEGMDEQNWMKLFLRNSRIAREDLPRVYGTEWLSLLDALPINQKEIFLEQFEGHNYIRRTAGQVAELNGLDEAEVIIMWQQTWIQILVYLENNPLDMPLLTKIYNQLKEEGFLCSSSVHETYLLLKAGVKSAELAKQRKLKQSTINDHITELAILFPAFPFDKFLKKEQIKYVEQNKGIRPFMDYKDIQKEFPEITFFESRLMQVMSEVLY